MPYWLLKADPETDWSWDQQVEAGTTFWDGVRNHQASNNLKQMKLGDRAFFYHSQKEKRIVGLVEIVREYYPDHTDPEGKFGMVDVKTLMGVKTPVTLAQIKGDERLAHLALVRQSRLSVMPIDPPSWKLLCEMAGITT
ncbi:MAG: EVE domain-containing protein [Alphaproteobacteria bacterium]